MSNESVISNNIFNTKKTDYQRPNLFLDQPMGLMDTINKNYPEIWNLYKKLKALDWDENEFDFTTCNVEFKTCPRNVYDMMIRTLAWQWEADSIVARHIAPVVAPFVSSSELWATWARVTENEALHSFTYSEIVRNSFDDPDQVLEDILKVTESLQRLVTISSVMDKAYITSHKLALGLVDRNSQEVYNDIFMFVVALLCLERLQFMSSFAVTFAIANSGMFVPIGKAVQKICQDEYEIHGRLDKEILRIEMGTERGRTAYQQCKDQIKVMIDEVVFSEITWTDYLFSEGRELVGVTPELLKRWVLWMASDIYKFMGIEPNYELPTCNPLGFMDDWIRNDHQVSSQEDKSVAYMLGAIVDNVGDTVIDIEF